MQQVQEAVDNRGQRHGHRTEEGHAAVQGIKGGEEFAVNSFHFVDGPHAGEYHGSIVEAVHQGHFTKKAIARRAEGERKGHQCQAIGDVPQQSPLEPFRGGQCLVFVFKPLHLDFFVKIKKPLCRAALAVFFGKHRNGRASAKDYTHSNASCLSINHSLVLGLEI